MVEGTCFIGITMNVVVIKYCGDAVVVVKMLWWCLVERALAHSNNNGNCCRCTLFCKNQRIWVEARLLIIYLLAWYWSLDLLSPNFLVFYIGKRWVENYRHKHKRWSELSYNQNFLFLLTVLHFFLAAPLPFFRVNISTDRFSFFLQLCLYADFLSDIPSLISYPLIRQVIVVHVFRWMASVTSLRIVVVVVVLLMMLLLFWFPCSFMAEMDL